MAKRTKKLRGEAVMPEEPNWDPLERAVAQWLPGQFMAMHEVQLTNGARLCAYKHIDTRRYLHLDAKLNAYRYACDERSDRDGYEPIPLDEAFASVLLQPEFEIGWFERGRFDRRSFDDEGNEIEDRGVIGFVSRYEERVASERWSELRAPLPDLSRMPGGD